MSTPEESYRSLVQQYAENGQLSTDAQEALETNRMLLRLLPDQAKAIEQELLKQASKHTASADPIPDPASQPQPIQPPVPARALSNPPRGSSHQPAPKPADLDQTQPTTITLHSDDYPTRREQYKQVLRRAYMENILTPEIRAELGRLAQALGLKQGEEAAIANEITEEFAHGNLPNLTVAAPSPLDPSAVEQKIEQKIEQKPAYSDSLKDLFETLEQNLQHRRYPVADQLTHDILLKVVQPEQSWLDLTAISSFSPNASDTAAMQEIDRLWNEHSQQKFGFGRQLNIYGQISDPLKRDLAADLAQAEQFSQAVDWWIAALGFYKFYAQLDLESDAATDDLVAAGHLPAYWFWQLPRRKAFDLGNFGLRSERGGCRVDAATLPAFMRMLRRCGIKPIE